jgi:hypothetical protein
MGVERSPHAKDPSVSIVDRSSLVDTLDLQVKTLESRKKNMYIAVKSMNS